MIGGGSVCLPPPHPPSTEDLKDWGVLASRPLLEDCSTGGWQSGRRTWCCVSQQNFGTKASWLWRCSNTCMRNMWWCECHDPHQPRQMQMWQKIDTLNTRTKEAIGGPLHFWGEKTEGGWMLQNKDTFCTECKSTSTNQISQEGNHFQVTTGDVPGSPKAPTPFLFFFFFDFLSGNQTLTYISQTGSCLSMPVIIFFVTSWNQITTTCDFNMHE